MKGRVCLVTGATNGIGKATASELANMGATVVVVGRDAARVNATVDEIKSRGSNSVHGMSYDLAEQAQVRVLAEEFKGRFSQLHVLVNNAGAVFGSREESADGIEMTLALNHLSPFLLTNLLLDTIKASGTENTRARIINLASSAHASVRGVNFEDIEGKRSFSGWTAYAQSKLANLMFTYELARRLEGSAVTSNAVHPGLVRSGFSKGAGAFGLLFGLLRPFILTPEKGAKTSIYLVSSPEVEGVTGKYFSNSQPISSTQASYDERRQARLWQISEQMTGMNVPV